ncbi:hypothetical protein RIEGSTA812A_PEG_16 [invertebrate metagenome]|uniref:Uncharacterized protein n=1 Tax=invertebrate metagenome TaxID=1711999 RepID=A0A484H759_9ZZZZ
MNNPLLARRESVRLQVIRHNEYDSMTERIRAASAEIYAGVLATVSESTELHA